MISRFIGKPPYITKSYSRTCRRQNSPNLTSEIYSFAFLNKKLSNYYKEPLLTLQKYKIKRTFPTNQKKIKL